MKAMKAMKEMKAMKAMKAMKVSKIAKGYGARSRVFRGAKEKTASGMTKDKLTTNQFGKVVSKAASAQTKKRYKSSPLRKYNEAVKTARKKLGIEGFVAMNSGAER